MAKLIPSLLVVPELKLDETPASWVQRICQKHQCSYRTLFKTFGMKPPRDPDLLLRPSSLARLALGTQISVNEAKRLGRVFSVVRRRKEMRSQLNFDIRGRPKYRFCPACLAADTEPYWRIAWRFLVWEICPIHRIEMQEKCPHCEGHIKPYRANIGIYPETGESRTCRDCPTCRMPLSDVCPEPLGSGNEYEQKIAFQKAMVSAALNGYFRLEYYDKQLPLDLLVYMTKRNIIHGAVKESQDPLLYESHKNKTHRLVSFILHQHRHEKKFSGSKIRRSRK